MRYLLQNTEATALTANVKHMSHSDNLIVYNMVNTGQLVTQ